MSAGKDEGPDLVDKVIKYLAKREGIDKTLKVIRYSSRLLAAVTPKDQELHQRFAALDSSVGVSRKAFRLGKFLQDYNNWRKSRATGGTYLLEAVAYGGEGIYYFIEQIVWLMKAGALSKEMEKDLAKLSAWAEFLGYIANIVLSTFKLRELAVRESKLLVTLDKKRKEEGVLDQAAERELRVVRAARALRVALIVQDLADSTLAVNDIRGGSDPLLSHPVLLAVAGLISASVSSYKNWTT
mmetsp:Transcript_4933/g.10613  ORF Transcript_4933/g.10613 Transcript_4933/m.10613 type:complete len:241 (+) Transcript_4933:225-947(+)